jgi:hypothetical protein
MMPPFRGGRGAIMPSVHARCHGHAACMSAALAEYDFAPYRIYARGGRAADSARVAMHMMPLATHRSSPQPPLLTPALPLPSPLAAGTSTKTD